MSDLERRIAAARSVLAMGAGTWEGPEVMPPAPWMPDGLKATGRTHGRVILDGRGLASDYEQEVDGDVTLTAHTVFTVDGSTGAVHMHFFSQEARPMELVGEADGSTLTLEGDGPGGRMRQTFRYSDAELQVTSEGQGPDGAWSVLFSGTYARI